MAKNKNEKIDNLFYYSGNVTSKAKDKAEKRKAKEREKRIKQQKEINKEKSQFDYDTETVINMTNKNNQKVRTEQQRKLSKKQRQVLKKQKRIKKIIKFTTLLLIIIGGTVFALVSPIFNIENIEVTNNNQLTSDTVISLSEINLGQNIFKFNKKKVKEKIKTNAYIENVNIKRKLPNKIAIEIEERSKDYNVEFLNGYAYINKQGYILEVSEQKLELPTIQGISTQTEQIVAGNRLDEEDLKKLEVVIQIINSCKDYNLDTKITNIDISNKNDYTIYMEEEKKTIYLGDDSNLSTKMLYVQAIIEENKGIEGSIYVDGDFNSKLKARFREKV